MQIKPIADRVLVKPDPKEVKTSSGIILQEQYVDKPLTGTVIEVGPKAEEIEINDRVYYGQYAGTQVEEYLIMKDTDILGKIKS